MSDEPFPPVDPGLQANVGQTTHRMVVFAGRSNQKLAQAICDHLDMQPGKAKLSEFADGEINVEIDENVRGANIFLIQSTCNPVNRNLMEMLIMLDALKRASSYQINVVIPYYGYARQDRKVAPRAPITAKLVADLLTVAGAERIISVDLHSGQIQGFFDIPFDNLYAMAMLVRHMRKQFDGKPLTIVSPDAGGVERARAYAKRVEAGLAIVDKRRDKPNESEVMHVLGDVKGQIAVLVDDMVDTAGTLCHAAQALKNQGAKEVWAYITHPVLSGPAVERIVDSPLKKVVVTDTLPLKKKAVDSGKLEVVSVAPLLGEAIRRVHIGASVNSLFI